MRPTEISEFIQTVMPELDEPEVYLPDINQVDTSKRWDAGATSFCFVNPVPFSASIANMGAAILYDLVNNDMGEDFLCNRCYFPEKKLIKRMSKAGVPLFDKEDFHQLMDYDVIGIGSFYSLQYYGFPSLFEMAGIPIETKDRGDELGKYPIMAMGGVQSFNAEPVAPMFDVIFVGEGEESVPHFLRLYRECKAAGNTKTEFLVRATNEIQGIYVPSFYDFEYYPADDEKHPNQIKRMFKLREDVPDKITKGCIDFKKQKILTKTFVGNSDGGDMSIGSVYIATSCGNECSFCQGSHISLPYRERNLDDIKKATIELIKNTGCTDITPYSFNLSDFSNINTYIKWLMVDMDKKVSMSSQRLDLFNEDFAKTAKLSGALSITVAIEAASPRARHILNKHLSEKQILDAFDIIFRVGFAKVKIYNIANVPFETQEDIDYYSVLAHKIHDLKEKYNAKTQIRWSFTPFMPKNCTPLQWAPSHLTVDEQGIPIFRKTLDSAFAAFKECEDRGRVGTNSDVSLYSQVLTYGDRRYWKLVKAIAGDSDFSYIGGMSLGAKKLEHFTQIMQDVVGLGWDYIFREKDEDEIFAWDYIDAGITKEYLLNQYKKAKAAADTPVDCEGYLRPNCLRECSACGACQDKNLPVINRPDHKEDIVNIADELQKRKQPKARLARVILNVTDKYRFVHSSKMKMRLRKAIYNADFHVRDLISFASDVLFFQDWTSGKEIAEVAFTSKRDEFNEESLMDSINKYSDESFKVERVEIYPETVQALKGNFESILYATLIPQSEFSADEVFTAVKAFNEAKEFIVKVKVPGAMQDSMVTERVNAKEYTYKAFAKEQGNNTIIYLALAGKVSPYDVIPVMLNTTKRRILHFISRKEEYLLKTDAGSLDMFSAVCEECGQEIERTIFDEDVDPNSMKCLEHYYLSK